MISVDDAAAERTSARAGRTDAAWVIALAAVALAAYYRAIFGEFVLYDDNVYITGNAFVRAGLTREGLTLAFTRFYASNWHPLTWVSHMLDVELFGLDPRGHHAVSLAIHALNAGLLYLVLRSLTGDVGPSAFAAALFAGHPLHVESVAWVSERKDLLCGLFWLLTLWAYARYVRRGSWRRYVWVVASFALCLMAKPMGVTLPLILLLLDVWPLGRWRAPGDLRRLLSEKAPLFALAALSSLVTYTAQSASGAVTSLERIPFFARAANAVLSYWGYLGKMLWPAALSVFYPHREPGLSDGPVLLGMAALVAVTWVLWRWRERVPYLLVGWLWYLVALLPVVGLVQVGEHAMADRYTYLPLLGPFVALAWGVRDLIRRRPAVQRLAPWAAAVVLLALAGITWRQTGYWKSTETLFAHALRATEANWLAHNNYGVALFRKGLAEEAVLQFEEVARLRPRSAQAHVNLAAARRALGRLEGAAATYRAALAIDPGNSRAHNGLGLVYEALGRDREAAAQYEAALRAGDDRVVVRRRLGALLVRQGRFEEARLHLAEVARRMPASADARYALGVVLAGEGRTDDAAAQFQEALRLRPEYSAARYHLDALRRPAP